MNWLSLHERVYAPYSGLKDCGKIISKDGFVFDGVRIENASYPLTITGIQAAYASAISEGKIPSSYITSLEEPSASYFRDHSGISECPPNQIPDRSYELKFLKPENFRQELTRLLDLSRPMYSQFRVSALIGNRADGFISGVNFETPIWAMGLCAERTAIAKALSNGFNRFEELHVITEKGSYCSPCGACRQVLNEINPGMHLHLHHPDGSHSTVFARDLLPYSFGIR